MQFTFIQIVAFAFQVLRDPALRADISAVAKDPANLLDYLAVLKDVSALLTHPAVNALPTPANRSD